MLTNLYRRPAGWIFQQTILRRMDIRATIGIPMGINCAPLLADLFLYSYEADFVLELMNGGQEYLDSELEIKETNESATSASCLDCIVCMDNGKYTANFPFLGSNIPSGPAYGVYVSQLIRYARACPKYQDFVDRGKLLTTPDC